MKNIFVEWREMLRALVSSFGCIFVFIESYELFDIGDLSMPLGCLIIVSLIIGGIWFFCDGYWFRGYLKSKMEISTLHGNTKIIVKFGDLFEEDGWKAIAVNDFFDHTVDNKIISSNSLHGKCLQRFWGENISDWKSQIDRDLNKFDNEFEKTRAKGNRKRYPIGTAASAETTNNKFVFVATTNTNIENNVTSATTEMIISAARGLLIKGRQVCSMETLNIPLLGTGLSRVNSKPSTMLDLLIGAILEESQNGLITKKIQIILHSDHKKNVNLQNCKRNWENG